MDSWWLFECPVRVRSVCSLFKDESVLGILESKTNLNRFFKVDPRLQLLHLEVFGARPLLMFGGGKNLFVRDIVVGEHHRLRRCDLPTPPFVTL